MNISYLLIRSLLQIQYNYYPYKYPTCSKSWFFSPFSLSSLLLSDPENLNFKIINYLDPNPIIPKTEQKLKSVNITEEKCVTFQLWDQNAAKMDWSPKILIVIQLDVNTILFQSQTRLGITEKSSQYDCFMNLFHIIF